MKKHVSLFLFFLLLGCGPTPRIKPKKKKKPKKETSRVVVKVQELDILRKKLAPKTPKEAIEGFFYSLKEYNHAKAYAYLDEASLKKYPKNVFLQKLGMRTPFGVFLNQCIRVQIRRMKEEGKGAKVQCEVTFPNLYAIAALGEQIKYDWEKTKGELIQEKELIQRLEKSLKDKAGKLLPEYQITFVFDAYLTKEKGNWWIQFDKTIQSLEEAFFNAALEKQKQG